MDADEAVEGVDFGEEDAEWECSFIRVEYVEEAES